VVVIGFTVAFGDTSVIGNHVYVTAPLALRLAVLPVQRLVGVLATVSVGNGFTVIAILVLDEHAPVVPTTVYVVLATGLSVIRLPVTALGFVR
jgi:hypothetical protein